MIPLETSSSGHMINHTGSGPHIPPLVGWIQNKIDPGLGQIQGWGRSVPEWILLRQIQKRVDPGHSGHGTSTSGNMQDRDDQRVRHPLIEKKKSCAEQECTIEHDMFPFFNFKMRSPPLPCLLSSSILFSVLTLTTAPQIQLPGLGQSKIS